MDLLQGLDAVLKSTSTLSGLWLIGLLVVRSTARGRWKLAGLEWGPVFDPRMVRTGKRVALVFGAAVALIMLRTFLSVL